MILREYLYVDTPAVRAILAQLDSGIVERTTTSEGTEKTTGGSFAKLAEHSHKWSGESQSEKSLGDYLFPLLESTLESEMQIEDISLKINDPEGWRAEEVRKELAPGEIVRLTAPGYLIDARFIAAVLTGFTTTVHGLGNTGSLPASGSVKSPNQPKGQKQGPRTRYQELPHEKDSIESDIPLGQLKIGDETQPLTGEFLRGVIQVARGMFAPGLHLSIAPEVPNAGSISVRLQEGKQYLDSDPDVLFARYGVGAQDWTVVGTIGHHPLADPDMNTAGFMDAGRLSRAGFGRYINQLATLLGNLGFTDLPQSPGFSIVPWAVYRVIGNYNLEADPAYVQ